MPEMNPARPTNTSARLMMTSMSYRRYLVIATPIAPMKAQRATVTGQPSHDVSSTVMPMEVMATRASATTIHLIWWRTSVSDDR